MRMLLTIAVAWGVLATPGTGQEKPKADGELAQLAGHWKVVSTAGHGQVRVTAREVGHDGQPEPGPVFKIAGDQFTAENEVLVFPEPAREVIPGSKVLFGQEYATRQYRLRLPDGKREGPRAIDLIVGKDVVLKGIYELKGDELRLCVVNRLFCLDKDEQVMARKAADAERPTEFTTKAGGRTVSYVLTRVKE